MALMEEQITACKLWVSKSEVKKPFTVVNRSKIRECNLKR
jgi:hypothetical protein